MPVTSVLKSLNAANIDVAHEVHTIPRSRVTEARRVLGLGLSPQVQDVRAISVLALRSSLSEESVRDRLVEAGVLAKRRLKRVTSGRMRSAEEALGLRQAEPAREEPVVARLRADPPSPTKVVKKKRVRLARRSRSQRSMVIGKEQALEYLTAGDIKQIHWILVKDFRRSKDPIDPPGVRSQQLLESAAHRPRTALGATEKYPTVAMASAALLHSIVLNHAFHNGNKRTALVSTLVFADRNGYRVDAEQEELYGLLLSVASHDLKDQAGNAVEGSDAEVLCIAAWLLRRLRSLQRQELSRKWHKFRQILGSYGCFAEVLSGNKINIFRTVEGVELWTQVGYRSEGTDVEINAVKKVRRDLQLDEENGYPSDIFYRQDEKVPEFINGYRTLLRQLAKV